MNLEYKNTDPTQSVYIYGLVEPDTGFIRYIGKSIYPEQRFRKHLNDNSVCHRTNWIKSLKQYGLKPELVIIEEIRGDYPWQESEKFWIKYAKQSGCQLVNSTDGGDGVTNLSGESKERMLKTWIGRKHKPKSLLKIAKTSRGRKHSAESKQKMHKLMSGRKFTDEWCKKISQAVRKFSDEEAVTIKKRIISGELICNIAKEYSVCRGTIRRVKNRNILC